jgi:choloylglycine hydrolase
VYDRSGKCIVIEPINKKLVYYKDALGVITNSPAFDWHMTNLRNYISLNPENVDSVKFFGKEIDGLALGAGNGMLGLPGDFTPPSRFVRAAVFSTTVVKPKNAREGIKEIFHILNNFDIPKGSVMEKGTPDYTLFTVARDPQSLSYYYRTYDDQTMRVVHMNDFNMNGSKLLKLSTAGEQKFIDMSGKLK